MYFGSPIRPTLENIFGPNVPPKDQWLKQGLNMMFDATVYRMDEVDKELDQWQKTKIIPKELENEILTPEIISGPGNPWSKTRLK